MLQIYGGNELMVFSDTGSPRVSWPANGLLLVLKLVIWHALVSSHVHCVPKSSRLAAIGFTNINTF